MVGGHDDERVVVDAGVAEVVEYPADQLVGVGELEQVSLAGGLGRDLVALLVGAPGRWIRRLVGLATGEALPVLVRKKAVQVVQGGFAVLDTDRLGEPFESVGRLDVLETEVEEHRRCCEDVRDLTQEHRERVWSTGVGGRRFADVRRAHLCDVLRGARLVVVTQQGEEVRGM